MPEPAVEPMWLARTPHAWADVPAWMSFSDLRNIESCPRRWSLSSASYPDIWSGRGYPPKMYLATLSGQILHIALEMIVKSLNRAGCASIAGDSFVTVMRDLGGYTKIIDQAIARLLTKLSENPRFTPTSRYVIAELKRATPSLRENLQVLASKLRLQSAYYGIGVRERGVRSPLNEGTYAELELRVESLHWHGFVDILTVSESNCEIVDFKTGEPAPEHEEQVRIYSLLWARDEDLNPQGRIANCLTLSYSREDIAVKSLTDHELDLLERDLVLRSSSALAEIRKTPPPAVPSVDNCTFCSVRQLCDDYWADETQELLAPEKSNTSAPEARHLADFEVEIGEQESPSVWRAVTLHGRALPRHSHVVLRIPEADTVFRDLVRRGRRLRLVDASLIADSKDEPATPFISLNRFSEVFLVECPTST